jgi:hypothetical protein
MQAEDFSNQRRHDTWVNFLLTRSDVAWRSGDQATAGANMAEAVTNLNRMLEKAGGGKSFMETLLRARFLLWQQEGRDLFSEGQFAELEVSYDVADRTCSSKANQVRQAILTGNDSAATRITAVLLGSGYYEPGFIRVCTQYRLCQ